MSLDQKVRVRFAPSPTGPLHIGGVRTALYNYLFARKNGGTFILRIEDTDQKRFVAGADEYIMKSLEWLGLIPDEGPEQGGDFGPYRQSERKNIYGEYARYLIDHHHAYLAFDTEEELDEIRKSYDDQKISFKYDASVRHQLKNSLTLSPDEVKAKIEAGESYVVRMLVPENEEISFSDIVREEVTFSSNELDDKVILKADGMPTYHLANVIDDFKMKITHVIRGEEWISSTAHHVLLYRMLGWGNHIPKFVHLPLILKPGGGGKLSKRDGQKMNMPVFPLRWKEKDQNVVLQGFREEGFLPEPTLNFLAMLGWAPGDDREIFSKTELTEAFSLDQISSGGARFDMQKARWFNQQYLIKMQVADLLDYLEKWFPEIYGLGDRAYQEKIWPMFLERIHVIPEFTEQAGHFFTEMPEYDEKQIRKKYKPENKDLYGALFEALLAAESFGRGDLKSAVEAFIEEKNTKFGVVLPVLRLAVAGSLQGPDLFRMMEVLGREKVSRRLQAAPKVFEEIKDR